MRPRGTRSSSSAASDGYRRQGPYRVLAFEAVTALRARGFKAARLEGGFPEWKAAGLVVETGAAD
ncbi:sulfurtransferase [Burkholderia pseudomallei]|nr:sulfurtransferase [Burkholderia pseudomallei]